MPGRPELGVLAAALLLTVLVTGLPASAQLVTDPTTTTAPTTTSTTTGVTLLSTTTTTPPTSTSSRPSTSTTSARPTTTTTLATGPVVTLPARTTTTELLEPPGPVGLPTTTSLAPRATGADQGLSAGTIVWLVIAGLLSLALVVSLFTVRYVRATRPAPALQGADTVAEHG